MNTKTNSQIAEARADSLQQVVGHPGWAGSGREVSPDGLGVGRLGNAILCYAYGETDRPDAFLAKSSEDVRRFIVTEWIGDDSDPHVQEVMDELARHDWREERKLLYEFEIGGVRFEDVVAVMPNAPSERL